MYVYYLIYIQKNTHPLTFFYRFKTERLHISNFTFYINILDNRSETFNKKYSLVEKYFRKLFQNIENRKTNFVNQNLIT